MTTVATVPAYTTQAYDLDGKLKIQQIQERLVIRDAAGKVINGGGEGELLPIRLITAPLPGDAIEATLKEALDAATAGALLRTAEVEAQLSTLQVEHDRLRVIVDAFPQEESGGDATEPGLNAPGSAAEAGADVLVTNSPEPGSVIEGDTVTIVS